MQRFYHEVYEIVAQIPHGKVTTYGEIAFMLGRPRGARMVGWALRAAPPERHLPCHRVVNKSGELAPVHAFGGYDVQRAFLESEGVTFDQNGRVCVRKHLWDGIS